MAKARNEGFSLDLIKGGQVVGSVAHVFEDLPKLAAGVQDMRIYLTENGGTDVKLVRVNLDKMGAALRRLAEADVKYIPVC